MEIMQFAGGAVEIKIIYDHVPQDLTLWTCTPIKLDVLLKTGHHRRTWQ